MIQIEAIDIHSHFNCGGTFGVEESEIYSAEFSVLRRINNNAGIRKMAGTTFSSVLDSVTIESDNDYLYRLAQENEDLYQWVVVDPRNEKTFQQAHAMLQNNKCLGIKVHPTNHGYSFAEYGHALLAFASDRHAVVLTHPETDADYILPYADAYPDATIIVAHLGSFRGAAYAEAIEKAKHQNVYTDTSGIASTNNLVIEYTVNRVGSTHILFGTDTYAAGFQRGRIEYAGISAKDKENILRKNAQRLFGIME